MDYSEFFVSGTVHERKVTFDDGSERVIHLKRLPALALRRFALAEQSGDDEIRASSMFRLISDSLCRPDGKQAMTFEEACTLDVDAAPVFLEAVLAVSGKGGAGKV
jgi:hypothetical protein